MSIENARITNAEITMADYGCLTYWISVEGAGWGVGIGGYCIGKGYLDAKEFTATSGKGLEAMMRVMDVVGVEKWSDLKGKYVRVELNRLSDPVTKIGNIIKDKWFDHQEFFNNKEDN